ncbi:DUF1439 domain-containing protein [Comamonas sp. GB3 AK4-5]|uniref:DUF1439 domain-containing protein n=1 Tax=Comamonas sp. GB3 AK4-5 TaxID=3231487 RepID=UPI00351EBC04
MQRRRFLLSAACAAPLLTTACSGRALPRQLSMSTQQLQAKLASKFPKAYPVAGLLQLELAAPTLSMLPERNLIRALLPVLLSGPVLKQHFQGRLDVNFGLRYEASDRTVRAHRVEVNTLQVDDAPEALSAMLTTYGPRLGEQMLESLVLYQLEEKDMALADTMGLQPGAITVTPQGLTVALDRKKT